MTERDLAGLPADPSSFDMAISDAGRTVRGRLSLDDLGAQVNFSTTDRFSYDRRTLKPEPVWHPPWGEFAYADVAPVPDSLAFNVGPVI